MSVKSTVFLVCGVLMVFGTAVADSIIKPSTFTPNTLAKPNEVNDNFDTLYEQVNKLGAEITIDSANKRVGISSAAPDYTLEVGGDINFSGSLYQNGTLFSSDGASAWTASGLDIYYESGKVGIGTINPGTALDVNGTITATGFVGDGSGITGIVSTETDPNVNALGKATLSCTSDQIAKWNGAGWACAGDDNGTGAFVDTGTSASYTNGNIGIGTGSPVRKLHISDAMRLEPRAEAPKLPEAGDLYFDSSQAYCVYVDDSWTKIAGSGTCTLPFVPKLPDSGQTTSYTTTFGEDHDYTMNPPSYTFNGDGTTTDNVTGLMWQSSNDGNKYSWYEAVGAADPTYNPNGATDVCGDLDLASYTDWRLPGDKELALIVNHDSYDPCIDQASFPGSNSLYYWSSTVYAFDSSNAWFFNFTGCQNYGLYSKSFHNHVRCVRGEQLYLGNYTDNGDGTVTDEYTSLVWQQEDDNSSRYWESALSYCEGLDFAGSQDWRLPNIKELKSITDMTASYPAISQIAFPNTDSWEYWSSTTPLNRIGSAFSVDFGTGYINPSRYKDSNGFKVRCVRSEQ